MCCNAFVRFNYSAIRRIASVDDMIEIIIISIISSTEAILLILLVINDILVCYSLQDNLC